MKMSNASSESINVDVLFGSRNNNIEKKVKIVFCESRNEWLQRQR